MAAENSQFKLKLKTHPQIWDSPKSYATKIFKASQQPSGQHEIRGCHKASLTNLLLKIEQMSEKGCVRTWVPKILWFILSSFPVRLPFGEVENIRKPDQTNPHPETCMSHSGHLHMEWSMCEPSPVMNCHGHRPLAIPNHRLC